MQALTFTQKLLRQRYFFRSLIPLLALFVGLGASQTALGAVILSGQAVTVNQGNGNNTYAKAAYNNFTLIDQKPGSTTTPAFEINTGTLVLNGGTLTTTENGGSIVYAAFIDYVINDPTFTLPIANGRITLTQLTNSAGVRTFSATAADIRVIEQIMSAGNGYAISVSFIAKHRIGLTGPFSFAIDDNGTSLYNGFFDVTGTRPVPDGVTFSNPTVIVNQGSTDVTRTGSAFHNASLVDQKPGSTTTPAFDINTGTLTLKGGSTTTNATGTSVVSGVNLNYIIYTPSFSIVTQGMLQLSPTGPAVSGVRTFSLTTGTADIILPIPTAANGYTLSISYQATYQNGGGGFPLTVTDNNTAGGGNGYNATFNVAGTRFPPPTVSANTITFDPNGVPPATTLPAPPAPANVLVVYNINPNVPLPFQNANLSAGPEGNAYDVNSGQLLLNNTSVTTTQAGSNNITSVILYYRTRLNGTAGGAFQPITLAQSGPTTVGGQKTFIIDPSQGGNAISQPNLIATPAVTGPGTYNVDVYYQANGINSTTGIPFSITDPPTSNTSYTATFTVTGSPVQTTIWTGSVNDNWFDAGNWSNGVPTPAVNALIRDLGAGNAVPYPNIYVNTSNPAGTYNNTGLGPAQCLNLTMGGSSQAARSIARLQVGRLIVYGNFNNQYDSFVQRDPSIIEFGGTNQTISGGSFVEIDITGGGDKRNSGLMTVTRAINFINGLLTTDITQPRVSVVDLADRAPVNNENGAQLVGENDVTYLRGFVRTTRQGVLVGETRTYGNIGMQLTFTGTVNPSNVDVTRNTVESYNPLNNRFSIRRIFGVRPSVSAGAIATMVFRYRNSETMNLGGTDAGGAPCTTCTNGTQSIQEVNLVIFISQNSGNTFGFVGRDSPVDEINNTVTKAGVRTFATFTLGDRTNPLPVRLTAFDAKRMGANALVTWQTATEQNSRGYDVQVSTNGKEFRTLSSVPSASPNSIKLTSYSYLDTEANKTGTRYYRLRQIDLDGKEAFFAPAAVNFESKVSEATALVAYPNPFNSNDELHLALQSKAAGKGQLLITDLTGRTVRQESIEIVTGITDFTVAGLADLKPGTYLVRVSLPGGETKNVKVIKQ